MTAAAVFVCGSAAAGAIACFMPDWRLRIPYMVCVAYFMALAAIF